ncbi:ArsR/SmtB family transcription factor [Sphingomonas ginkgonis]|uniref:ArsR/SmtB family transcription factor n=1 Tax=Sphingomonas ginkgonis TaxID=2315330 RepID=UPI001EEF9F06|nr:metalloregulator ArsR/SmtB family transcription factor [Sphingomonas ginkgonis]
MTTDLPLADRFQALADPTRLRIVALLRAMELSVGELAQVLAQSQPRVSRHIKILGDAGLVERRKEGSWVFLNLVPEAEPDQLFALLDGWSDEASRSAFVADGARLTAVRQDRAEAAQRFFAARASDWDDIRSLHVAETEVEAAIAELLGQGALGRLVDIGTGTGRMIELFGPRATSAIGIDRSSEMLRLARAKLDQAAVPGASFRQGDMYALPLPDAAADIVILHQVLHYAQNPAAAIAEAGRVLAPGGRLLVIDFALHEREDLRSRDAHVRLGFATDAIRGWLKSAGLRGDDTRKLEGGELTVMLWSACKPAKRLRVAA